ncbi:MAG: response regulator [Candidatus Thorarchaeota archaeon]|jgi:NarL family two-component system response regulator LiaR
MAAQSEIRVLIVDDHPMVREGLSSMLTAPGIEVIGTADSGQRALEMIADLKPDVTLLDIRMPDMSGLEVLQHVKESQLLTRVMIVTTYRNISYLVKALAAGASGYVLKDISQEELLNTVQMVNSGVSTVDHEFLQGVLRDLDEPNDAQTEMPPETIDPLTPREMDVLRLIVEGLSNKSIAEALVLSPTTVKGYVTTILEKLDVSDRTQAAVKAIRSGLVQ